MRAFILCLTLFTIGLSSAQAPAADAPASMPASAPAGKATIVNDVYPGLASGGLIYAKLSDLPKGTLLRAGELTLSEKDIADQLAKAPKEVQDQLRKNCFFLLEQMATGRLVLAEAKANAAKPTTAPADANEQALIQSYLGKIAEKVKVSDEEIAEFYRNNKDAVGGAELDKVKPQIGLYLMQQKQQEVVAQHVRLLGKRNTIELSASWTKDQAALARDNPVDKARASGKPSLVDFGSQGCRPCDMLAPILETLKKKYEGKANVLFVSVREEQILADRYGVETIPVQIFFDKDGKEMFRHMGFFPQEEIEKQMAKLGVK